MLSQRYRRSQLKVAVKVKNEVISMLDEELPEVKVLLCKTNSRKDLESYRDDSGEDTG